jgi:hypothetical protein
MSRRMPTAVATSHLAFGAAFRIGQSRWTKEEIFVFARRKVAPAIVCKAVVKIVPACKILIDGFDTIVGIRIFAWLSTGYTAAVRTPTVSPKAKSEQRFAAEYQDQQC